MELTWEKDEENLLRTVAGSPYVVVHGQPMCLTRGFDKLAKKAGKVWRKVRTPVEELDRPMKLVSVVRYYPVLQRYEDLGEYWADMQTGTLYDQFSGNCMSSSMLNLVIEEKIND